jgi:hypothetical protein
MNIDKLVQDWKEEIELINIDGFSKKISSIDINKLISDNEWKITFNIKQDETDKSNTNFRGFGTR